MDDLFEDICMEHLISDDVSSDDILLIYPYKLHNEKILRDNIVNMKNIIKEYINESEQYRKCMDIIPKLIWDSQRMSMQNKADKHQRNADKIYDDSSFMDCRFICTVPHTL